jgi:putative aminopeptidase FrvX
MQRRTVTILLVFGAVSCSRTPASIPAPATDVAADIAYLASPALEGRAVGRPGGDRAALFILSRYEELGLRGVFPAECPTSQHCDPTPVQVFTANGMRAENVVVAIPGTDASLRHRYILVAAHYDHLGWPTQGGRLRRGADDNASGTAALLELARRLNQDPAPATVLLAHFDAEELGLLGSRAFVEASPVPLDSVTLMVNLDMIGRLTGDRLIAEVDRADDLRPLVDSLASDRGFDLRFSRAIAGRSDHSSFGSESVPTVALFTGFHDDYHEATDVPERLNYSGLIRVVDLVETLVRNAASRSIEEQ